MEHATQRDPGPPILDKLGDSRQKQRSCKLQNESCIDTPGGWDTVQRDLDKKWAHGSLMQFEKTKYKVLHLDQGDPWYQSRLGNEWIRSSPVKEDLECWWEAQPAVNSISLTIVVSSQPKRQLKAVKNSLILVLICQVLEQEYTIL
ncbi:hypothetical protein HGM15179_000598 [Zosterops borbonicus]|uniref:Uncharacterized protein n=1 Tax=Zosterops borbonicus TaxID=364589 RepID=A0A8K1GYZ0_9PASS|nr:hypothetical protein HGM15179_000598 [Zosterops borbonicus]